MRPTIPLDNRGRLTEADKNVLIQQAQILEDLHRGRKWNIPQRTVFKAAFGKQAKKRFLLRKGRKGGGTETILYPPVRISALYDKRACYIIGPTATLEREIIWDNGRLRDMIPKKWIDDGKVTFNEKDARVKFWNGSFIKVTGADDWRKMVGIEGDCFIFDEFADHDPRAYKNCLPNILSRDAYWFAVSAPPIENIKSSFMYQEEQRIRKLEDWFFLHWTTYDNAEFLPGGREAIDKLKWEYERDGNGIEFDQRYMARYLLRGKSVVLPDFIPENEDDSHVYPHDVLVANVARDRHKLQWWSVFDPGYATCFCALFFCYNEYTGEIFLLDEVYETNRALMSDDQLWPRIRAKEKELYPGRWHRLVDSAAPGFVQNVLSHWKNHPENKAVGGFEFTLKEEGDEDAYFKIMNAGFKKNYFKVSSRCKCATKEFEDYSTNEQGRYPDSKNHAMDDFRYLLKRLQYTTMGKPFITIVEEPDRFVTDDKFEVKYVSAYETDAFVPKPEHYLGAGQGLSRYEAEVQNNMRMLEQAMSGSYGDDVNTDFY